MGTKLNLVTQDLKGISDNRHQGLDFQIRQILKLGCERFNLDIGILSKISGDTYKVIQVVCPDDILLKPGDIFELSNTYCSITLASRGTVYLEHVRESSFRSHPAYRNFQLEAYIGIPVMINDHIYGTLNFSSPNPASRKFLPADIDALQLMAAWLANELWLQRAKP